MPGPLFAAAQHLPDWLQGRHIGDLDHDTRDARTLELLQLVADTDSEAFRQECLDQVVLLNGPVAEAIAARYRSRGIDSDDLVQVAYLGLVKAAQGYRMGEGPGFLAYAVPTVSGEIKRYFRDFGWMVRPPRRVQELRGATTAARAQLHQEKGRPPTNTEVSDHLGASEAEIAEADLANGCFSALSLDAPATGDSVTVLADLLVDEANDFEQVESMETLRPALAALSDRDRKILLLRFIRGWTQEQIGREIGVSQMQVSRLLNRILDSLRATVTAGDDG